MALSDVRNPPLGVRPVARSADYAKQVRAQIEKGMAIKNQKLRYAQDLEKARDHKLAWTQQTTDILKTIFSDDAVAEDFNTWAGKVLPEFAELGQFIEQFLDEMEQRLAKLFEIYKRLEPSMAGQDEQQSQPLQRGPMPVASNAAAAMAMVTGPQPGQTVVYSAPRQEQVVTPMPLNSQMPSMQTMQPQMMYGTPQAVPQPTMVQPMMQPSMSSQGVGQLGQKRSDLHLQHLQANAPASMMGSSMGGSSMGSTPAGGRMQKGVLIVHVEDAEARGDILKFMQKLGFQMFVIQATPESPKGAIEKFDQLQEINFAILLLGQEEVTAVRRPASADQMVPRSRLHQTFEIGYCIGKLGVQRVYAMYPLGSELFKDEHGIIYLPIDPAEGWQLHVAKLMRKSGIEVDLNRVA